MVGRRAHQHPGCEFLYVVEGELDILHGEGRHRLEAGDAVYFDANTPHSYSNSSNAAAKALIVTLQGPPTAAAALGAAGIGVKPRAVPLASTPSLRTRTDIPQTTH